MIPYDVDRAPGGDERADERARARHHSRLLNPHDIVVSDRGYFARARLAHPIDHRLHAVFRIRRPNRTADTPVDQIFESTRPDTRLTLKPRKTDPAPSGSCGSSGPPNSDGVRLTTLVDSQAYPAQTRADLYHPRGSIEDRTRTVRQTRIREAFSCSPGLEPARRPAGTQRGDDPHRPPARDVKGL